MTVRMRNAYISLAAAITLIAAATALRSEDGGDASDGDRIPAAARKEIKAVELEIDRIEAESLHKAQSTTLDRFQQITLLGRLIFYDKELSVKRNECCSFCHMPETGFSGPVSALNQMTVAYPGSIRTRSSADESLNLIRIRVSHQSSTTIRNKVILSAASSGICAPQDCGWTARWPSRHRVLRWTPQRWA